MFNRKLEFLIIILILSSQLENQTRAVFSGKSCILNEPKSCTKNLYSLCMQFPFNLSVEYFIGRCVFHYMFLGFQHQFLTWNSIFSEKSMLSLSMQLILTKQNTHLFCRWRIVWRTKCIHSLSSFWEIMQPSECLARSSNKFALCEIRAAIHGSLHRRVWDVLHRRNDAMLQIVQLHVHANQHIRSTCTGHLH